MATMVGLVSEDGDSASEKMLPMARQRVESIWVKGSSYGLDCYGIV